MSSSARSGVGSLFRVEEMGLEEKQRRNGSHRSFIIKIEALCEPIECGDAREFTLDATPERR